LFELIGYEDHFAAIARTAGDISRL